MKKNSGMILILSLWILSILAVFAGVIGMAVRQKIGLLSRLEKHEKLHYMANTGVQIARVALKNRLEDGQLSDLDVRSFLFNNPSLFKGISSDDGLVEISYQNYDDGLSRPHKMFGVEEEESKLNINTATAGEMQGLFMQVAGMRSDDALDLGNAIVDWRSENKQTIAGFYGEEYYHSLNFPYEPKRKKFESLEELLLVKGMNPDIFDKAKDFITIYGEGAVDINTASRPVLLALGMTPNMADLIIKSRDGSDGIPFTEDDRLFVDTGASINVGILETIDPGQLEQIDRLYVDGKLTTVSNFFRIHAKASLPPNKEIRFVDCIVYGHDGRILAWREY